MDPTKQFGAHVWIVSLQPTEKVQMSGCCLTIGLSGTVPDTLRDMSDIQNVKALGNVVPGWRCHGYHHAVLASLETTQ